MTVISFVPFLGVRVEHKSIISESGVVTKKQFIFLALSI